MGIRVHKTIGYGFLKSRFGNDPRFNSHVFNEERLDGDLRPKLLEYIDEKLKTAIPNDDTEFDLKIEKTALECKGLWENNTKIPIRLHDVIKYNYYNTEGDNPIGPILFTIPYQKDWYRYDDAIDYQEEPQKYVTSDGCVDHAELITDCEGQPAGIYPYCSSYCHRNTGERWVDISTFGRWTLTRLFKEDPNIKFKIDNKYGIKNFVEWQRHIVPKLPSFISLFCDCFEIFRNPLTKYRLRPMIFTYWS